MRCGCNNTNTPRLIPGWFRKLLPTIVLVTLAILAGATDIFSTAVHDVVSKSFKDYIDGFMPHIAKLLVIAIVLNIAWLVYHPICRTFNRFLARTDASERGKDFAVKFLKLAYWGVVLFIILTGVASEFAGKFVLGFSVLGAALTLAMQGAANDFICGVLMQFTQRLRQGDEIQTIGLDVKGKVVDVGFLSTQVESPDGLITVPNREIWARATKVVKPAPKPSLLIIPSGIGWSKRTDDDNKESK